MTSSSMRVDVTQSGSDDAATHMFAEYLAAWGRHDPDAVAAFHTEESVFTVDALGVDAVGRAEVRAAVAAVFALWPDIRFNERRLYVSADLAVFESLVEGTLASRLTIGDTVIEPNGRIETFLLCDVFRLRDGRIVRKDAYLDALGYAQRMRP